MTCDIGVVGLGVMGGNLARNIESRGFAAAGYDLSAAKTQAFAAGEGRRAVGAASAEGLAEVLVRPRKVLLMVPAGQAGRRRHRRRSRRCSRPATSSSTAATRTSRTPIAARPNWRRAACSISAPASPAVKRARCAGRRSCPAGPARHGTRSSRSSRPSPRGPTTASRAATTSARTVPGHYVKMVHNGIEYVDMQLICEAYDLLQPLLGMSADEIAEDLRRVERGRPRLAT